VTVAQLLRKAGYATAIVGKWGLGMPEDHSSPLDFGFDHHFGYLCQGMAHTYYPPYLWRDNGAANLLAELGLASTPVALHSDNSAAYAGLSPDFFHSNGNLRGYKEQLYEGGIRTPFIARWPGRIKAGTISTLVGAFWDMLPRLCELAGSPAPADIDGLSIVPTLLGQPGQKLHQYLYWEYHSAGGAQAVRFGDWKAVCNNAKRFPYAMPKLYDLARDPGEKTNLADQFPELAAKAAGYMKAAHSPSKEAKWDF
jgi:arylsulfatase A-like enzyme